MRQELKDQIDGMSQVEMATALRFAPAGDPLFVDAYDYFMQRFNELGGMTPAISKNIGWR